MQCRRIVGFADDDLFYFRELVHSPDTSVLNEHCQAHDVKNLFVADGGPFVTQADKNLTWTIMALAMRTGDYIAKARNRGEL